jgi:hypothetical protein
MKNKDSEEVLFEIVEPVRSDYVPIEEILFAVEDPINPLRNPEKDPMKHDKQTGS